MKLKPRILFALRWVLCFAIGKLASGLLLHPKGQSITAAYLLHQLWPYYICAGAPITFLIAFLFAPWYRQCFQEGLEIYNQRKQQSNQPPTPRP